MGRLSQHEAKRQTHESNCQTGLQPCFCGYFSIRVSAAPRPNLGPEMGCPSGPKEHRVKVDKHLNQKLGLLKGSKQDHLAFTGRRGRRFFFFLRKTSYALCEGQRGQPRPSTCVSSMWPTPGSWKWQARPCGFCRFGCFAFVCIPVLVLVVFCRSIPSGIF